MSSKRISFLSYFEKMGFKENLKAQLQYSDILVKELAARTGIKKSTLDSYLRANGYTPSIEAGVKIARALGVTAEYLVTGREADIFNNNTDFNSEARSIYSIANRLNEKDRSRLLEIAKIFKKNAD